MKEDAKTQITIVSSTGGNSKNSSPTEISGIRKMGLGSVEIDASKSGVQTEFLIVRKENSWFLHLKFQMIGTHQSIN